MHLLVYFESFIFLTFDVDISTFYFKESEVIIEELHDDDSFDYANMPPLVNVPSPIFLSHTDPPFLYQYIGDQVKILQVLGNDPLNLNVNKETNANTDHWDQTNTAAQEESKNNLIDTADNSKQINDSISQNTLETQSVLNDKTSHVTNNDNNNNKTDTCMQEPLYRPNDDIHETEDKKESVKEEDLTCAQNAINKMEDRLETTSLDTSINDNDSAESDDEASFGTPEDSPKAKRKSPKGKYGKGKAPPPPKVEMPSDNTEHDGKTLDSAVSTTSQESLNDIINMMPNTTLRETGGFKPGLQVVNPIAEKKRQHKSKSPNRVPKGHSSGISKLLQLPNKLAFWHKTEDKSKCEGDVPSTSSEDHSRRSSTIEKQLDDFQSCFELNLEVADNTLSQADGSDDLNSFKDACDLDSEIISHDIIEKSDALQKLIEAKIESHPEYKFVSLHDEIPTSSKSTDV